MKYGQSVPQTTARNMSTKENPSTLPINLYAQVQPTIASLDFSKIAKDRQEGARTTTHYDNSHELLYASRNVVFLASDAYTLPCTSPVHGPSPSKPGTIKDKPVLWPTMLGPAVKRKVG